MNFLAGAAKHETTCFIPGMGMMGYGQPHNTVKEVATALFARCLVIQDKQKANFVLVHLEQAFVSMAIKEEIVKTIQAKFPDWKITDANLLITAQHTHSAPGGYSHYPFYNFTISGFYTKVFKTICDGIMSSIEAAFRDLSPSTISLGRHSIDGDKDVAFNRSMKSYLQNPEAMNLKTDETHLALNRQMEGLFIKSEDGELKAMINWFGVHATSISSFNHRIHHDNKGVAAKLYEESHPGVTAFFLQAAAGDVSPNYIWDKKLKRTRGKFADQYENASYNGEIQFRESEKVTPASAISGPVRCFHDFIDMARSVSPPAHGVAFFLGTKEGPGVSPVLGKFLKVISKGIKKKLLITDPALHQHFYENHEPMDVLLDHRSGSFLGIPLSLWKKLPPLPDPTVEFLRKSAKNEAINTLPWVPEIIPFQMIILGPLLIAAVPGEITTMAAQKLKSFIIQEINDESIKHVIISSYANAYMGYITTEDEYLTQSYEAGHTVYGRNTLRGILEGFKSLIDEYKGKTLTTHKIKPFHFPPEELARRSV